MMTYTGDALIKYDYSSATLTFATPNETADRKIIVADKSYVFDPSTTSWDELEQDAPFLGFTKLDVLVGYSADALGDPVLYGQLSLVRREVLDGVDTHVISGRLNGREYRPPTEESTSFTGWVSRTACCGRLRPRVIST